jgi:hypothetical protein
MNRRWLHRIGYATTAVVLAQLLFAAVVVGREHLRRRAWAAGRKTETAWHAGPLAAPDYMLPFMAELRARTSQTGEGLLFLAYPALDQRVFAVALRPAAGKSDVGGMLLIIDERLPRAKAVRRFDFRISAAEYRQLVGRINIAAADFDGSEHFDTDGTDIAIERVTGGRMASGHGNMIEPYRSIGEQVLGLLRRPLPNADLPQPGHDWYVDR